MPGPAKKSRCRLPSVPGAGRLKPGRVGPLVDVAGNDLIRRHHQVGPLAAGHHVSGLVESDGHVPRRAALRRQVRRSSAIL